jgi:orotate phosphoribosyltransferase-like protein
MRSFFRDTIVVVDDMLTTGCHFKAMQAVLRNHFPTQAIVGVFVARRGPESDFDDFLAL